MKRIALLIALSLYFFPSQAQTMNDLGARIKAIEDKMAIKNLVDTFSILADQKQTDQQRLLFTENGVVESVVNGQPGMTLTGRQQIGDAFGSYLKLFDVVYHINGQQTLSLTGDKASGVSYCTVTLIGMEAGKKMKTSMGVYYQDEYVRQNGHWLIAKRRSNFAWQEKKEVSQ